MINRHDVQVGDRVYLHHTEGVVIKIVEAVVLEVYNIGKIIYCSCRLLHGKRIIHRPVSMLYYCVEDAKADILTELKQTLVTTLEQIQQVESL